MTPPERKPLNAAGLRAEIQRAIAAERADVVLQALHVGCGIFALETLGIAFNKETRPMNTFTKKLPTVLTPSEIAAKATESSKAHARAERLKLEARDLTKRAKALDVEVDTGREERDVPCIEVLDFERNEVRTERTDEATRWPDGSATVAGETRDMTAEDRQLSTEPKAKASKAKRGAEAEAH